jgi:hypothetical protein
LKYRPGDRLFWDFSWFPSVSAGECRGGTLKSGNYLFLPNPFQLIIHLLPFRSTVYGLSYWKSIVK